MPRFFKNKFFVATVAIILLLSLPVLIFSTQQKHEDRSHAAKSTTLYLSPANSTTIIGERTSLNLMINPGANLVNYVKVEIIYDPAKLKPSPTSITVNQTKFPKIIQGPIFSSGKIQITLSIGADQTKAIRQISRVATLSFSPIASASQTVVSLGSNSTVMSISSKDAFNENVLSTTIPAYIKITKN